MKKSALRLPKLKTRDELLRTAPELGRLLAADGEAAAPPGTAAASPLRARSPTGRRAGSPRRIVRNFSDDELTEEERVRAELEKVKAERAALLDSLAKLRADVGKSGGELQQEDIRLLRRELAAKQEKLNELRRATHELSDTLEQLETTSRDCEALMPQAMADLQERVAALAGELAGVERDMLEAEAKHELLKLLEVRTRRDHDAAEQRMRNTRALKEGAFDDLTTLAKQMHEMRAAKEDAERVLGGVVMMYDQVRSDWHKKLKDRRKEVRELERRKAEDVQRREQQAALAAEKARIEAERAAKTKAERDVATARLSAVVPELEALEATWARLHGICGAATAEDVIAYWQDLKAKEANMRELVRLAEVREARAKQEMAALLAERAEVFDAADGSSARGDPAEAAAAITARPAEQATQAQEAPQAEQVFQAEHISDGRAVVAEEPAAGDELAEAAADVAAHQEREAQEAGPLEAAAAVPLPAGSSVQEGDAVSPQQAAATEAATEAAGPSEDGDVAADSPAAFTAAEEDASQVGSTSGDSAPAAAVDPSSAASAPAAPAPAAAPANPDVAAEQQLLERQAAIAEARRRKQTAKDKFSKLSQVCVAADQGLHLLALRLKAAMEPAGGADARRRTSMVGGRRMSSVHRRTTGQHQAVRRMSATQLMDRRGSITMLAAPGEPGSPRITVGSGIHDKQFFPELPGLLSDVSGRLGRLMQLVEQMEAATAAAAEAQAAAEGGSASQGSLSSMGTTEASEASLRAASSKKLKWADGQTTPPVEPAGQDSQEAAEGEEGEEEDGAAAADGEKALRKGFRRRTWAGPAWLDAVTAGKPLTAALRKQLGARSPGAGSAGGPALTRVVRYVDPGSSEDEGAGTNPFDLAGSSDDELEEGGGLVDRQYLKHRAHVLTNPRNKSRGGAAGGSPTIQVDVRG